MLGLLELLALRGFVPDGKRVKLVRHTNGQIDIESLARAGWLETYQKFQSRKVFDKCNIIIVFIGEDGNSSRFVGIYDVGPRISAAEALLPPDFPIANFLEAGDFFYSLEKRSGFEDLENRLIINWGAAPLAWHQWFATDREVIEFRRRGNTLG